MWICRLILCTRCSGLKVRLLSATLTPLLYNSGMPETHLRGRARPKPFMEHPTGQFATAVEAMADAIQRLRALPEWDNWITFCAQGAGQHENSYHLGEIRMRRGLIDTGTPSISRRLRNPLKHRHPALLDKTVFTSYLARRRLRQREFSIQSFAVTSIFAHTPIKATIMQLARNGKRGAAFRIA